MHPALVHLQHIHIQGIESGIAAYFQVVGAGGGIGRHLVVEQHPDTGVREGGQQALVEHFHCLGRRYVFRRLLHGAVLEQVDQGGLHLGAQVRKGGVTGVEDVRGGTVQLLGVEPEICRAAGLQHAHHRLVLAAHAPHDGRQRVQLSQFADDIPLNLVQLGAQRPGIIIQQVLAPVVIGVDDRQLPATAGKKGAAHLAAPLDGVEDPDRPLGLHNLVGQLPHQVQVFRIAVGHLYQSRWYVPG